MYNGQHPFALYLCPSVLPQNEWNKEGNPGDAAVLAQVACGALLARLSDVSAQTCDLTL